MQLFVFRPDNGPGNFGDEINVYLWPKILPKTHFDSDIFFGIGTYLREGAGDGFDRKIVFGSGAGYGNALKLDGTWDVRFVRGPRTAEMLGLGYDMAITDPAILVANLFRPTLNEAANPAFMPHWSGSERDHITLKAIERLGFDVIDPTGPVDVVIEKIRNAPVLFTAALHGAVVADALRVRWVPIFSDHQHDFKWRDWAESLELKYEPHSLVELGEQRTKNLRGSLSDQAVHSDRLFRVNDKLSCLVKDIEEGRL